MTRAPLLPKAVPPPDAPTAPISRAGALLAAIVAAAVLTPPITLTARLPDIRVEQLLAVPALAYLLWGDLTPHPPSPTRGEGHARLPYGTILPAAKPGAPRRANRSPFPSGKGVRGLGPIDAAFLVLALAALVSVLYAPAVLGEPLSPRDGYEVVKLGLYWTLFRFGLQAGRHRQGRQAGLDALFIAGSVSAVFALAQYFDWLGVNGSVASWWAPAHHLRALERDGRAFGTVGNPNYFGALMAMVATLALAASTGARGIARGRRWTPMGGVAFGTAGVVLSGSRGALGMLMLGVAAASLLALLSRYGNREPLAGWVLLGCAVVVAVAMVEVFPRGREDYLARVTGALSPAGDSSLRLRLERWRGAFRGSSDRQPTVDPSRPEATTGRPPAGPEARARDDQRRRDARQLVELVKRYQESAGTLPAGPSLDALVPGLVAALPVDPLDGSPYRYERTAGGFTIAARLEDPASPDYPLLALGEARNYLLNGDVGEAAGRAAAHFRALPGTVYEVSNEAALFGSAGIVFRGNPDVPDRRAAVYQQRYFGRPGGTPFTASVWVILPARIRGEVLLYVNVLYTDGERRDPFARVAADRSQVGVWQRLSITVTPDASRRIDFIGVYLLSDEFAGEAHADGFELVDGSVPVAFPGLPEAVGSASLGLDAGAQFRRSPLFGVGPRKATEPGAVDNEYLLVAARYGLAGLAAYLALWMAVLITAVRRSRPPDRIVVAAGLAGVVLGLLAFNLVAGSLYHLQLMGVLWPVAGMVLSTDRDGGSST